jgi:hypothetical protein
MKANQDEIARAKRFAFGENWELFLITLTTARIHRAKASLKDMLEVVSMASLRFLDAGSSTPI